MNWIEADWPASPGVRAGVTLRTGGVSTGCFRSWNLGGGVKDDPAAVERNRALLQRRLGLRREPLWLRQEHRSRVVEAGKSDAAPAADAGFTREPDRPCVVTTADCVPVLLCAKDGSCVAAVHAGWRGLAAGVIEAAVDAMQTKPLLAWLGPAIGPARFEVGPEVRAAFLAKSSGFGAGFCEQRDGKWLADLYRLATMILHRHEVVDVYGGCFCTYSQPELFFSHRRDGVTGRMATLIWRTSD